MKWAFWRKDNPVKQLDPHMLAIIMVQNVGDRTHPFNKWRTDENPIPERADAFVETAVNVYQLCILLDFLERKFSADVSGLVRWHLIALMSKGKIGGEIISPFFDAVQIGRALPEREQFFADKPEYQVDCNVAKSFLSIASEPEDVKTVLYPKLGQSLTLGRISAESCFGKLVEEINFSPVSIFGLRKPDEIPIRWSQECGCFERHLQRRDGNALLPPGRRRVSTAEVTEARAKDLVDLQQLEAGLKRDGRRIAECH